MATNNRGGNRGGAGRNNNPEGRNQHSGMMGSARDNPLAAAAVVGGAVAAGLFLWSRRNEISDQISSLSDQISEWREGMSSDNELGAQDEGFIGSPESRGRRGRRTQAEISEEALTLKEIGEAG